MKKNLITSEKCAKECLGEGLLCNGCALLCVIFYYPSFAFVKSFEMELFGLGLFIVVVGLLLKFWFRTRNVLEISSGILSSTYGNLFFSRKRFVLDLKKVKVFNLTVSPYFSSLSTRHIKLRLVALDDTNISHFIGEGSDKFWSFLYKCVQLSKDFNIPIDCDLELNEYLVRISQPTMEKLESEYSYKIKAIIELVTDFFIWLGVAMTPCVIFVGLLVLVGPRIS